MTAHWEVFAPAIDRAVVHARHWLASVPDRPIPAQTTADAVLASIGQPLPDDPCAPELVIDELAAAVEPGLMSIGSGRFFGWVMGGSQPAPLAADWLTSTWDQNSAMRAATPGTAAVEEAAATWLLDLLGLPASADVGFTTGATTANLVGLGAARHQVLADVGWDVETAGLSGSPRVRVLAGAERHGSVDLALRYLGLGTPFAVAADDQGRIRVDDLARELAADDGPTIVCLQAGNLHSGAFDPFSEAIAVAHDHAAWVHIDGAFGLWAAAAIALLFSYL